MKIRTLILGWMITLFFIACQSNIKKAETEKSTPLRWTVEQAQAWSAETGWLRGCNFNPSTAINQPENPIPNMHGRNPYPTARNLNSGSMRFSNPMEHLINKMKWT